jgi:hypothetical protein
MIRINLDFAAFLGVENGDWERLFGHAEGLTHAGAPNGGDAAVAVVVARIGGWCGGGEGRGLNGVQEGRCEEGEWGVLCSARSKKPPKCRTGGVKGRHR